MSPNNPCTEGLVPSIVIWEDGETFKKHRLGEIIGPWAEPLSEGSGSLGVSLT